MHAAAAPAVTPPHAHRRPVKTASLAWRIIRTILASLGALFLLFMVLGITLGSKPAGNPRPAPRATVTVPGPTKTVTTPVRAPVRITVRPTVITINVPPD
jgi:hypothetical protein